MATSSKQKPVHLILQYGYCCRAVCDKYIDVVPIESGIKLSVPSNASKGTFNPKNVTCKRCLKHPKYKQARDKVKNPLFYWRENAI